MLIKSKPVLNKYFRLIIFLIVCFLTINALGQKAAESDKFTLSGKLIGRDTGIIVLKYLDKSWKYVKDTVVLKEGRFEFTGNISESVNARFIGDVKSTLMEGPGTTTIFLEPSDMLMQVTEGDFQHLHMTGSQTQTDLQELNKSQEYLFIDFDSAKKKQQTLRKALENGGDSIILNQKMKEQQLIVLKMYGEIWKRKYNFIRSHPKSFLSPYLLQSFVGIDGYDLDSLKQTYKGFAPIVRISRFGKQLDQLIKSKESAVVGNKALHFSAKDINGKTIELSQFKNKSFVLLDFWASWCAPCREQAPYFKKLHEEFKNKGLELISISSDVNRDYWKQAIKEDGIGGWTNVLMSDAYRSKKDESLSLKFAIRTYPTTILIDKDGVIIYRKEGSSEAAGALELKNKIEEHMK
nr:TlpA disulfide reductase family protein [Pedobacter panaciterrae]